MLSSIDEYKVIRIKWSSVLDIKIIKKGKQLLLDFIFQSHCSYVKSKIISYILITFTNSSKIKYQVLKSEILNIGFQHLKKDKQILKAIN